MSLSVLWTIQELAAPLALSRWINPSDGRHGCVWCAPPPKRLDDRAEPLLGLHPAELLPQPHGFEGFCSGGVVPRFARLAVPKVPGAAKGRFDPRIARSHTRANPNRHEDATRQPE
jgi:hypothetical protein